MNSAIERIITLRVKDAMSTSVVTVTQSATMAEAAALLKEHNVRGLPVVDWGGKCVGMITTTDFARRGGSLNWCKNFEDEFELVVDGAGPSHIERVAGEIVEHHMTQAVHSLSADATLLDAARYLCKEHIHRLVVLDEGQRPAGILSSLDIVAAMVAAIEE